MKVKTNAKINLSIDVVGKRNDGYHLVEMIMQSINLYDILDINEIDEDKIIIKTNSCEVPTNDENIVYKAVKLIKDEFNIKKGVSIFIQKNIPVAGGMAGGSSNCAGVLICLNKLWNLNLDINKLKDLGLKLGADVPFCIEGGSMLASNIGEKLEKIPNLNQEIKILVCKPDLLVSTKEVYQSLDINNLKNKPDNKYLINCLKNNDNKNLAKNMKNVLENVTVNMHKEIQEIKNIMIQNNALGSIMSGSGPTVFGLFDDDDSIQKAKNILIKTYKQIYTTNSSLKGVEIIDE